MYCLPLKKEFVIIIILKYILVFTSILISIEDEKKYTFCNILKEECYQSHPNAKITYFSLIQFAFSLHGKWGLNVISLIRKYTLFIG